MSTYMNVLPQVFPYGFSAPRSIVDEVVRLLMSREDLLSGSSFAVTAFYEGLPGWHGEGDKRGVWLSQASAEHLAMSGRASDELRMVIRHLIDQARVERVQF